jgi:hypothetical protein
VTYDLSFKDRLLYSVNEHAIFTSVEVHPPTGASFEVQALIDTGAEMSRFDHSLLPQFGIADVTSGLKTLVASANQAGTSDTGYIHDVEVRILGRLMTIPVVFCPAWPHGTTNLLGMEGFFDHWHFAIHHSLRRLYYTAI